MSKTPDKPRPPLSIGVMVAGPTIARWQAETIRRLISSGLARPKLVIVDATPPRPRHLRLHRGMAWNLYNRVFRPDSAGASGREAWSELLADAQIMNVVAETKGRFSQYIAAPDVEQIKSHNLDLILRFGFNILRGEILDAAKFGVWSYHHGDLHRIRGQPACFWEVYLNEPVTGVTLQRLNDSLDNGVVLATRFIATTRKSYRRTRETALNAGIGMVEDACRALLAGDDRAASGEPAGSGAKIFRSPGNLTVMSFACRMIVRRIVESLRWLTLHQQWNVGIIRAKTSDVVMGKIPEPTWLPHPERGEFLADPFAARTGDDLTIMAEHLSERENKGRIRRLRVDRSGTVVEVSEPITATVHLSYPCLARDGDRYLCVPEMAGSGAVALFESGPDLAVWKRIGTVLSGVRLIDPTLFRWRGYWWMFGAIRSYGQVDELHAWHAQKPEGPWMPHRNNPLKVDVRSTRPAGAVFEDSGLLFRPSQDCSKSYGGSISLNEITQLSPSTFAERTVAELKCRSNWVYSRGLHTISRVDEDTFVIDAKRNRFCSTVFWRQLRSMLS